MSHKALLIPYNSKGEIFLQDRTDYKLPPWGFFGGGVEEGETSLQAVIRESKEELDIDLLESDLEFLGEFPTQYGDESVDRSLCLYRTDQVEFTVLEGAGGLWVSFEEAKKYLNEEDNVERIKETIELLV